MAKAVFPEWPGAHVRRFFLDPANWRFGRVILQRFGDCLVAKWVVLFDAKYGDVRALKFLARLNEVVIHFSAGKEDDRRLLPGLTRVRDDALEPAAGKVVELRCDQRVAEQTFGREHNKRLPPIAFHLPTQAMEILSGRGGSHDLQIVFRRKEEEPFKPGARVFGSFAFERVWQQEHKAAEAPPLVFGARNKLIDDDLSSVHEVAILGFPKDEAFGVVERIAVFETHRARFAERAVDHLNACLTRCKILKDVVKSAIDDVVQHGVTMAKCASG